MARLRGGAVAAVVVLSAMAGCKPGQDTGAAGPQKTRGGGAGAVLAAVDSLTVKGRAPKTGYARERFGTAWADTDSNFCDTRVISMVRPVVGLFSQRMQGVVACA